MSIEEYYSTMGVVHKKKCEVCFDSNATGGGNPESSPVYQKLRQRIADYLYAKGRYELKPRANGKV